MRIRSIATRLAYANSAERVDDYILKVRTPRFRQVGGIYYEPLTVYLDDPVPSTRSSPTTMEGPLGHTTPCSASSFPIALPPL